MTHAELNESLDVGFLTSAYEGVVPADPEWFFREFLPGDNISDPDFTKALFSSDGESPLARSLVRESIQNSLDARLPTVDQVTVRFGLRRGGHALQAQQIEQFTSGAWPHLGSDGAGLENPPRPTGSVPFLVVEDFGTRGLQGDSAHWQPNGIAKNGFYLFFRALGRSGKSDEARGRWGVGKFVFPMSSDAHMIWALTVPLDGPSPLLMGRAVLRTHSLTPNDSYHPDGHWGLRRTAGPRLVTPVDSKVLIERFSSLFGLQREDTTGLSVVVPWVNAELTLDDIRSSVLAEYFLPLLKRELVVCLDDGDRVVTIDRSEAISYASEVAAPLLREQISLGERITSGNTFEAEWPTKFRYDATDWDASDLPAGFLDALREVLESGEALSIRVAIEVKRKGSSQCDSGYLTIHVRHVDGLGATRPLIVRDGISISEEKTKSLHDHVAIVTADVCALATLIGDAETPAHERLQHELIKDRYVYPRKMISFVREAAASMLRVIWHVDEDDDPFALANYFPLLSAEGKPAKRPRRGDLGPDPEPTPTPKIPGRPRRFVIGKVDGGVRVAGTPGVSPLPDEISILLAYDVRRGNPFKRYRSFDFLLSKSPIEVSIEDADLVAVEENKLAIKPRASEFTVTVTGFDPRRDVIVRVTATGGDS